MANSAGSNGAEASAIGASRVESITDEPGGDSGRTMPAVDRGYRRALRMAAVGGGIALLALSIAGNAVIGAMIAAGLLLGAWNSRQIFFAAPKITASGNVDQRKLTTSGGKRLGYVTLVVIVLAIGLRPVGWTVVLGLAAFQLLLIANTAGPLLHEVREG
ncbi:MAG: hypothetical protein ABJC62_00270 [Frankiaceae bacterium]